jgi:predicted nucleic acid-binding protein
MRYFDASALVKRYVREQGTTKVRRLLASGVPATSRFSAIEIASALARRAREGAFTDEARDGAIAAFETDLSGMLVVELTATIVTRAQALLRRHALRAADAVQLASCLYIQAELGEETSFVAFDDRLTTAARSEGLIID